MLTPHTADRCKRELHRGIGDQGLGNKVSNVSHAKDGVRCRVATAFLELSKQVDAYDLRCVLRAAQEVVYAAAEEQQKAFMEHLAQVEAENPEQAAPLEW